jgi:hypothetical protein
MKRMTASNEARRPRHESSCLWNVATTMRHPTRGATFITGAPETTRRTKSPIKPSRMLADAMGPL